MKVQFNKFLLGNNSDQCPADRVEVNGERSAMPISVPDGVSAALFLRRRWLDVTVEKLEM